jgi:hypothetical protein
MYNFTVNRPSSRGGLYMEVLQKAKNVVKSYAVIKITRKLTYEQLLDILKDETYSAGQPSITGKRFMRCIRFPEEDKYQIQIAITGCNIKINKVYNGVSGMLAEHTGNTFVDNWKQVSTEKNDALKISMDEIVSKMTDLLKSKDLLC